MTHHVSFAPASRSNQGNKSIENTYQWYFAPSLIIELVLDPFNPFANVIGELEHLAVLLDTQPTSGAIPRGEIASLLNAFHVS